MLHQPFFNVQRLGCQAFKKILRIFKLNKVEVVSIGVNLQDEATTSAAAGASLSLFLGSNGVSLVNLSDQVVENSFDVLLGLGGSLEESAVELLGKLLSLFGGNDTLILQVRLVANQNHRNALGVLDTENLISQIGDVVEG